jgi:hypothetical protein
VEADEWAASPGSRELCIAIEGTPREDTCALPTTRIAKANPNGIPAKSPGLRAASYPGKRDPTAVNPNGVAAFERGMEATTPLGLAPAAAVHPG